MLRPSQPVTNKERPLSDLSGRIIIVNRYREPPTMAFERDWKFTSSVILCLVMITFIVRNLIALAPTHSQQTTRLLGVVGIFSFVSGIVAFLLTMYVFGAQPTHMLLYLVIVILVLLLMALLSSSTATAQLNDMRSRLAAPPSKSVV